MAHSFCADEYVSHADSLTAAVHGALSRLAEQEPESGLRFRVLNMSRSEAFDVLEVFWLTGGYRTTVLLFFFFIN